MIYFFTKNTLVYCLSSVADSPPLLPSVDSEQEVPSGTTESVQSVDYYCDSKFKYNLLTFMLEVEFSVLLSFFNEQQLQVQVVI